LEVKLKTNLQRLLLAAIVAVFFLGLAFPNPHPHFWWQKLPVFDMFFGFFGAILIIVFAKWLGHNWLLKDQSFYDHD